MTQKKSNGKAGSLEERIEYLERQDKYHKDNVLVGALFFMGFLCLGLGLFMGYCFWGL